MNSKKHKYKKVDQQLVSSPSYFRNRIENVDMKILSILQIFVENIEHNVINLNIVHNIKKGSYMYMINRNVRYGSVTLCPFHICLATPCPATICPISLCSDNNLPI